MSGVTRLSALERSGASVRARTPTSGRTCDLKVTFRTRIPTASVTAGNVCSAHRLALNSPNCPDCGDALPTANLNQVWRPQKYRARVSPGFGSGGKKSGPFNSPQNCRPASHGDAGRRFARPILFDALLWVIRSPEFLQFGIQ